MRKVVSVALTVLVAPLAWTATLHPVQSDAANHLGSRVTVSLRFMTAVYPEERYKADRVQVESRLWDAMVGRELGVQLGLGSVVKIDGSTNLDNINCYGVFVFSDSGLLHYWGRGGCVRGAQNSRFSALVKDHPEWSDEDIAIELSRQGAKFPPGSRSRMSEHIPAIFVVSDIMGELVQIQDVDFKMPDRDEGRIIDATVCWRVSFSVLGNEKATVLASLEPFAGQLTSLVRIPAE